MISRPPIMIYKPYCCIASSSFSQLHFWSLFDGRKFSSTLAAAVVDDGGVNLAASAVVSCGAHLDHTIPKSEYSFVDASIINMDLSGTAKFTRTLNNKSIQKPKHADAVYRPLLLMEKFDKELLLTHRFIQTTFRSSRNQVNPDISCQNRMEILQRNSHFDNGISQCNHQQQEKLYWDDQTKTSAKKIKNNDLPSEKQLDEMMYYIYEQAPKLFSHSGWSYNKCSYKIIFENMILRSKTETLNAYIMQINVMKNITRLILSNPELSIMRMTKDVENGSLHIRWQVQGVPRYLLPFYFLGILNEKRSVRYIDGFSIFYVKDDGLYHRHLLLKMTPLQNELNRTPMSQMFPEFHGIYTPPLQPSLEASIEKNSNLD